MSHIIELSPTDLAFVNAQARALQTLEAYQDRPTRSTRRAVTAARELMGMLGCDAVADMIFVSLWTARV